MLDEEKEDLQKQIEEELAEMRKSRDDSEEFSNFLQRACEVESIVSGLASRNKKVAQKALMRADLYLHDSSTNKIIDENCVLRDKINKTVINQAAFDELGKKPDSNVGPERMSAEVFMKTVEADVKQRTEDRRQRKEIADRHKFHGNKAFRNKDYEKALACYNKAIIAFHESALLHTNRALTCLKLGLNQRALDDANAALMRNHQSVKGTIYKAEALYNLGRYEESKETIEEACKEMPENTKVFTEAQQAWLLRNE